MIIVIADDITGAAEIAGVALRHGIKTVLTTSITYELPHAEVIVIATDTRSGSEAEAGNVIRQITKYLTKKEDLLIFKKTDSVLRGHIVTELTEIINTMHLKGSMLLPQNPSKGRIIANGEYYINGTPLDKTDFLNDPEFPARTSSVKTLLKDKVNILGINENIINTGIHVADASDISEIKKQLDKTAEGMLLAGGADFFDALLKKEYPKNEKAQTNKHKIMLKPQYAIIICGSTQSKKITEEPYIKEIRACEESMPDDVFHGGITDRWISRLSCMYKEHKSLIVSIGQRENRGKDYAVRLRNIMAETTLQLVKQQQPELMIIEGGATAYAILKRIGWNVLKLKDEYAPGIVSMTYGNTEIILKPGSYPWGALFK